MLNPVLALRLSSTPPNAPTALADLIGGTYRLVEYKYNHVMYKRKSLFSCTHDGSLVLASERHCGRQQDAGAAPTCPTISRTSLLAVSVMRQITSCALPRHAPWCVTATPRSTVRQLRPRQRSAPWSLPHHRSYRAPIHGAGTWFRRAMRIGAAKSVSFEEKKIKQC